MPRQILTQYETDQESFLLNRLIAQALPPGVYAGYEPVLGNTMELVFQHPLSGKKITNQDNTQTARQGLVITKHGVCIFEPDTIGITITPTTTSTRLDAIYIEHNFVASEGGADATYGVIQNFDAGSLTAEEAVGNNRILIGLLFLPASTSALNGTGVVFTSYKKNDLSKLQVLIDSLFSQKYDKEQAEPYVLTSLEYGDGWTYDTANINNRVTAQVTQDNYLRLSGELLLDDAGAANDIVFILPEGYRPNRFLQVPITIIKSSSFVPHLLSFYINGEVRVNSTIVAYSKADGDRISLDNIQILRTK